MSNYSKKEQTSNDNSKGGDLVKESVRTQFDHIQAIEAVPLQVQVFNNFEKAMRAFRALVQKERILSLYKEKQRYEKPSDKKRRKKNEAARKLLESDMKDKWSSRDKDSKEREKV